MEDASSSNAASHEDYDQHEEDEGEARTPANENSLKAALHKYSREIRSLAQQNRDAQDPQKPKFEVDRQFLVRVQLMLSVIDDLVKDRDQCCTHPNLGAKYADLEINIFKNARDDDDAHIEEQKGDDL